MMSPIKFHAQHLRWTRCPLGTHSSGGRACIMGYMWNLALGRPRSSDWPAVIILKFGCSIQPADMPALLLFQNLFQSLFIAYRSVRYADSDDFTVPAALCTVCTVRYLFYLWSCMVPRIIYLFRGWVQWNYLVFGRGLGNYLLFRQGLGNYLLFWQGLGNYLFFWWVLENYLFFGQVLGNYLFSEKIAILFMVQLFFSNPCKHGTFKMFTTKV